MVAMAGGANIRCATYATFGTAELSAAAVAALEDRLACLLANHGILALGATLPKALALAVEVETLCEQYLHALQAGAPALLDAVEMAKVVRKFQDYGR
jgi:L-fuculose-phosphate aldolase